MVEKKKSIWPTALDKYDEYDRRIIQRLPMTLAEIVGNYRRSDKKVDDVKRLMELNGCGRDIIERIIVMELGADALPKKRKKKETEGMKKDTSKKMKQENISEETIGRNQEDRKAETDKAGKEIREKIQVSRFVIDAVYNEIERVDMVITNVTKELSSLEKKKKMLEEEYVDLVNFLGTHCEKQKTEDSE